jgi:glycerophosphoryl diester phosphodiesterase
MTLLGYRNPARRIVGALRGLVRRPRGSAKRRPVAVVGHRGAPREAAENTLDSFAKALDLGADAIETDVCVTLDGHFVLWHDCHPDDKVALVRQLEAEKTYRYEPDVPKLGSKWRRPVNQLTLEELRAHHGYVPRKAGGKRVEIALLEDLFEWSKTERRLALVCLDVKLGEGETAGARELAARVREGRRDGRIREDLAVAFLCPQEETLRAVLTESRRETLGRGISIFADFELPGALEFAKRFGADCVSFGVGRRLWSDFRNELGKVLAARDAGRIESVIVWTINDEKRMRELVGLNVDGILTDEPRLLRKIVSDRSPPA